MTTQTQLSTIQFYNHTLATFEQNNVQYVAMRPICENIGLSWNAQFERIKRDEVLSSVIFIIKTTGNDGKEYQMLCLPIEYLNGWLFGIDVKRVKPEIRDLLITYKKECYKALADYWMKGKAERKTTVDERTGLRDAVNMLVSKKGLIYSEAYQMVHQRFNVQSIEDLSQEQLPMAVEYVHKICLEGELIINEPEKMYQFSEHELWTLAWAWKAGERMRCILKELYAPLEKIGCRYSGAIYGSVTEYQRTLDKARQIIMRETEHIKTDPWENRDWFNVLYELRRGKLNNPI